MAQEKDVTKGGRRPRKTAQTRTPGGEEGGGRPAGSAAGAETPAPAETTPESAAPPGNGDDALHSHTPDAPEAPGASAPLPRGGERAAAAPPPAAEPSASAAPSSPPSPDETPKTEPKQDAEPDHPPSEPPPVGPRGGEPPRGGGRGAAALAALAILIALLALAAAAYLWFALDQAEARNAAARTEVQREVGALRQELTEADRLEADRLETLEQGLEQALAALQQSDQEAAEERRRLAGALAEQRALAEDDREQLNAALQSVQEDQRRLRAALEEAARPMAAARTRRAVSEALSLATAANERLLLARDVNAAVTALRLADERLAEVDDPRLHSARESLAADMTALRQVPRVDREGIALRLSALAEQTDELPVERAEIPGRPAATGERPARDAVDWRDWRALLGAVWDDLRGLVVVRRGGEAVEPLLPPEQQYFLRQNLQLKLQQARLALLMNDGETYRRTLEEAQTWLEHHFADSEPVRATREALAELAALDIRAELPELAASVETLRNLRTRLEREDRAP